MRLIVHNVPNVWEMLLVREPLQRRECKWHTSILTEFSIRDFSFPFSDQPCKWRQPLKYRAFRKFFVQVVGALPKGNHPHSTLSLFEKFHTDEQRCSKLNKPFLPSSKLLVT